jgi:glycosyltransferase involved in cell wall biosynthesis
VKAQSISCFFPCFNDRGTIASMVLGAAYALDRLTDDYEIIVVDDGSTDGSRELLTNLRDSFLPKLRLVFHEENRGYGGALISGFQAATKDWVFYTDGDAQYDPAQIALLFNAADEKTDLVQGYKKRRNDPLHRKLIGGIYQRVVKWAFGLAIRDVDCDFRLIRRSMFDKLKLSRRSGAVCAELVRKLQDAGARAHEVGIDHMFRAYGRSQIFNFRRLVLSVAQLAALWWELVGARFMRHFLFRN